MINLKKILAKDVDYKIQKKTKQSSNYNNFTSNYNNFMDSFNKAYLSKNLNWTNLPETINQ